MGHQNVLVVGCDTPDYLKLSSLCKPSTTEKHIYRLSNWESGSSGIVGPSVKCPPYYCPAYIYALGKDMQYIYESGREIHLNSTLHSYPRVIISSADI